MKIIYLLATLSIISFTSFAQQKLSLEDFKKYSKQMNKHSNENLNFKKNRIVKQRLIKDSTFDRFSGPFQWANSNHYQYSGEYGSSQYLDDYMIVHHTKSTSSNLYGGINGQLNFESKFLITYTLFHEFDNILMLNYNFATSQYDSAYKVLYNYTPQQLLLEEIYFTYNNGIWELVNKDVNVYDANQKLITTFSLVHNGVQFDSISSEQLSYIGNLLSKVESFYNNVTTWERDFLDTFTYNAQSKLIQTETKSNWSANTYNNFLSKYYFYDGLQRRDSIYFSNWTLGGFPSMVFGYKYIYNGSDTLPSLIKKYNNSNVLTEKREAYYDANKNIIQFKSYDLTLADSLRLIINYYYENYNVTNTEELDNITELKIYPNPASNMAYLEFSSKKQEDIKVNIRNLFGQVLYSVVDKGYIGNHLVPLPTSSLSAGLYLVEINRGNIKYIALKLSKF